MLPDEQSRPVLDSLLEIVKEIANLPECRNPSRRQFSNLVRRIKLLSPLFEELRDGDSLLGESEVRSFVSFKAALESSKSLLREINEGSKLFQALKWEKIANKFDEVTGQLEKALSEIPYGRLDISEEVREQVELVHAQLRRAKARKEKPKPDVQLLLNLSLAKNVKEVDRTTLHRLSEKLHLRTINDLMRESLALHEMVISGGGETVDFLEEMSTLLKKLKDFVVSENTDGEISDIERLVKHKSPIIPDDFRCPISLELMKDPVIVSTGQTYERSCIEKWLDAGHKTCPKTQQTLSHTALTPNYVLKSLIGQWCDSNGVEVTKRHSNHRNKKPGSCTSDFDRKAIEALMEKLRNGSEDEQRAAAGEIRLLAKRNADNRVCIAEAGAIPLLIELLASPDPRTQEHAVTALLNLSINESNKGSIVNKGAIPDIVEVLKKGSMEARENAAATLFSLSVIDENKVAIGAAGAIPALIDLLSQGSPRGKKDAATAIFNLAIYQGNKVRAVRAGIMVPLMTLLMEPGGGMMDEALAILAILASHPEGKLAIGQAEPIPVLVDVIRTGSPRNRENAAAVLWSLCSGELHNLMVAKENGIEETLKQLMESGTDRAKRKAGNLLELIRQSVEDEGEGEGEGGSEGVQ